MARESGIPEEQFTRQIAAFKLTSGSKAKAFWQSAQQSRKAKGELPIVPILWAEWVVIMGNAFGCLGQMEDVVAREQLRKLSVSPFLTQEEPIAAVSAEAERLALLGGISDQEVTKLDAFRLALPEPLRMHCLAKEGGAKFISLSELVTERGVMLTGHLKAHSNARRAGQPSAPPPRSRGTTHAQVSSGAAPAAASSAGNSAQPKSKKARYDPAGVPGWVCLKCWESGHKAKGCTNQARLKPDTFPPDPAASSKGGAAGQVGTSAAAVAGKGKGKKQAGCHSYSGGYDSRNYWQPLNSVLCDSQALQPQDLDHIEVQGADEQMDTGLPDSPDASRADMRVEHQDNQEPMDINDNGPAERTEDAIPVLQGSEVAKWQQATQCKFTSLINCELHIPAKLDASFEAPVPISLDQWMLEPVQDQHVLLCLLSLQGTDILAAVKHAQKVMAGGAHASVSVVMSAAQQYKLSSLNMPIGKGVRLYKQGYELYRAAQKRFKSCKARVIVRQLAHIAVMHGSADQSALTMLFQGLAGGRPARLLLDTGAAGTFISKSFVQEAGVELQVVTPVQVTLADDSQVQVEHAVELPMQFGHYKQKRLYCRVIPMSSAYEVILGQDWLQKHRAVLRYAEQGACVSISRGRNSKQRLVAPAQSMLQADGFSDMTPELAELHALQHEYADILMNDLPAGGPHERIGAGEVIPLLPGAKPVYTRPYRLSPVERSEVGRTVEELLQKGCIRPSKPPFGSPVTFASKKDGTLRMCVDYRHFNDWTVRNKYPLPRIDDLLDRLIGAKLFTSLDLASGYHQLKLQEADLPKMAFTTHSGLDEFLGLPFGLSNAPAVFQNTLTSVFGDLSEFVCVYMDDLLIFSRDQREHMVRLRVVLDRLRLQQLIVKPKKCTWAARELAFLGHIVGAGGIKADPGKI